MKREAAISVRLTAPIKQAIERLAAEDDRTVSQYVERLLLAHLKEKGELPSTN